MQRTLQLPSSSKSPCIVSSVTVCFTSTEDDPYAVTEVHKDKPKQEKKVKCMSHVYRTQSAPVQHHRIINVHIKKTLCAPGHY